MKELNGKNCVLTGAANGIGRALALGLAREGTNLSRTKDASIYRLMRFVIWLRMRTHWKLKNIKPGQCT